MKVYYDKDGNKVEVKFSTVLRKCNSVINSENVIKEIIASKLENRILTFENAKKANFDCNIQQVKPSEFDVLYYGCFFDDKIMICKINSSEIINDPSLTNTALKESDYNAWLNTLLVAQTRGIQEVVKPFDPTGMSRIDIINKIGIDNLVQQFLKKEVLTAKRTTTRPQAKKMRVLSQNLDALLYLGANTLSINEGIHLTTTRVNGKEM